MLGKQMRGEKETVKTFFFLEWKVKIMEVLTLVTVRSQQQRKGKQKKTKTKTKEQNAKTEKEAHTSEEQKTSRTFPLLFSMQCCFPLRGQVRTLQSSWNK